MAKIIQGKQIARDLCEKVANEASTFRREHDLAPGLAVVLVGDNPASEVYVRQKVIECDKAGIHSEKYRLPHVTLEAELLGLIARLNRDPKVHGILVQLPLPDHIDPSKVLDAIAPDKDVDGFHPVNVGRLSTGSDGLTPCTPLGCMMLIDTVIDELRGKHAVVIGKSNIVGKPVALLLLERECTVTVTHIATLGLPDIVRRADIVVVAAGAPRLVRGDWIKPGAVVIDVGITRKDGPGGKALLVGDCAANEMDHAGAVTPVPGGVGPMTIACLLSNTLKAARRSVHG
ncbi:bifunctional methylenetetrahydrofolate dehydrogenase/methenyltetrahydrofolate cyclohydrolase FolD [Caballeronia sp. LP006]|uniref:bifunctional 5,10-methylenetetrahydrofolate dehydrogenase/5,10-methenyltetrahydrofolate cyclohydrolase n=1 Tax=Caballeronia sp. LP006 TaxID=3038552 RepID=UPI0028645650|nr:bifunctional methylenetetrahydrofolate dehydrogenase/methenyltetrahydrofolate cyclohydrolase FolD [Caballeronia sp. LP006]MDR5832317.1 bifunctional methylenetetrahydrofolate dehydrogenase/methenyltetrahydrofolate cyclohydrolase FolD [Caballeronia sp. LP006]